MFSAAFGNPEFLKKSQFTIAYGHDSTLPFLIVDDQQIVCCGDRPFPEPELGLNISIICVHRYIGAFGIGRSNQVVIY